MKFVSGEAYFRCDEHAFANRLTQSSLGDFKTFLDSDVNVKHQSSHHTRILSDLQYIRRKNTSSYRNVLQLDDINISHFIEIAQKRNIADMKCLAAITTGEVNRLQKKVEGDMMRYLLQYFSILEEELSAARWRLSSELIDASDRKLQAKKLRDLQIFSRHLSVETKENVTLQRLLPDSTQAKRCCAAVQENLHMNDLLLNGFDGVQVLNVFKLEHSVLSARIQKVAESLETDTTTTAEKKAKVKGLFCAVPRSGIYGFSAFGLYAQTQPRDMKNNGVESKTSNNHMKVFRGLFQQPWYHCTTSSGDNANGDDGKEGRRPRSKIIAASSSVRTRGTAERLALSNCDLSLRFCRYSTPSIVFTPEIRAEAGTEGTYVALCRVLVKRVKTFASSDDVTTSDIAAAAAAGYDAVHFTSTSDYVLLKPENVLPEFIFHIRLIPAGTSSDNERGGTSGGSREGGTMPVRGGGAISSSKSKRAGGGGGGAGGARSSSRSRSSIPSVLQVADHQNNRGKLEDAIAHHEPGLELVLRDMEESLKDELSFRSADGAGSSSCGMFIGGGDEETIGIQFMNNHFNAAVATAAREHRERMVLAAATGGGTVVTTGGAGDVEDEDVSLTQAAALKDKLSLSSPSSSAKGRGAKQKKKKGTAGATDNDDGVLVDLLPSSPRASASSASSSSPTKRKQQGGLTSNNYHHSSSPSHSEGYSTFKRKQALMSSINGAVEDFSRRKLEVLRRTYIKLFTEVEEGAVAAVGGTSHHNNNRDDDR